MENGDEPQAIDWGLLFEALLQDPQNLNIYELPSHFDL